MEDNTIKLDLSQVNEEPQAPTQPEPPAPVVEEVKEERPASLKNEAGDYVVNLNQPADAVQEQQTESLDVPEQAEASQTVEQENEPTLELVQEEEAPVAEQPKEEEPIVVNQQDEPTLENVTDEVKETKTVINDPLPEGVDKFVDFMNETGLEGTDAMKAYMNLSKNPDDMTAGELLNDYYKATKPFLTDAQIETQLQKKYGQDTSKMEPDAVEEMNIAFQEELYKAKQHFGTQKERFYTDLKLRQQTSLPDDAREAVEFYNEYKTNQEKLTQTSTVIQKQIDQVFNEDFKGFDFKVGESKYRVRLPDPAKSRENHKDFSKVMGDFFSEDGSLKDAVGYNKALYAASNADKLAQHFYEQGRADAVRESAKKSKNIDMGVREDNSAVVTPSGQTVRVVSGNSKQQFKPGKMTIPGWNN